jgi:PAS domain S-box-containing protein
VSADLGLGVATVLGALLGVLAATWWWRRAGPDQKVDQVVELARRLSRAEMLARHANDMLVLVGQDDRLVDFNDRFLEVLGYSREQALQLTVRDVRDPATLEDLATRIREQLESGAALFETRYRRRDGTTFPVEISIRVAEIEGVPYRQAIVRDITERRRMELQLQLADRMASVATLSAGVAHEINNPLAYVSANIDFALSRLEHLPEDLVEVRKSLEDARGGASRVGQIVRDLRTFSRAGEAERQQVDVRQALQTAVTLAQVEIRQRAQLSLELGPVPPVLGNAHRLGQLFLNLLVNAAHAIPSGHPERNLVKASTAVAPDGRVQVEITDTGAGIPPEVLPRIFDPFFTTRAIGQGLGLGLAIVHGIVSDLGGEVTVRPQPGGGTSFTVLLPPARRGASTTGEFRLAPTASPVTPLPTASPAPAAPAPGGPVERPDQGEGSDILVIDDEPMVGRAISRMLAHLHRVTLVASGAEALALLATRRFDTILCDLMMPEMSGMALHDRLLAEEPALAARMVFLTGGAFAPEAAAFLDRVPNPRLEKPFSPAELRAVVAAAGRAPPG